MVHGVRTIEAIRGQIQSAQHSLVYSNYALTRELQFAASCIRRVVVPSDIVVIILGPAIPVEIAERYQLDLLPWNDPHITLQLRSRINPRVIGVGLPTSAGVLQ